MGVTVGPQLADCRRPENKNLFVASGCFDMVFLKGFISKNTHLAFIVRKNAIFCKVYFSDEMTTKDGGFFSVYRWSLRFCIFADEYGMHLNKRH